MPGKVWFHAETVIAGRGDKRAESFIPSTFSFQTMNRRMETEDPKASKQGTIAIKYCRKENTPHTLLGHDFCQDPDFIPASK